jgi:SAM-dependent methyltransferase
MGFMNELLRALPRGAVVLDIGSGRGSLDASGGPFTVVRADLERQGAQAPNFVQADAARLPFADRCFDLVISNNSLEHFRDLAGSLREIGRVVRPAGALYVAVPDCTTISDRLYRWLARGGGHVNPFSSAHDLARLIARATGLRHVATRVLCSSLACLNRSNRRGRPPGRLLLLGGWHTDLLASHHVRPEACGPFLGGPHQRLRMGSLFRKCRRSRGPRHVDQCLRALWSGASVGLAPARAHGYEGLANRARVPMSAMQHSEFVHRRREISTPACAVKEAHALPMRRPRRVNCRPGAERLRPLPQQRKRSGSLRRRYAPPKAALPCSPAVPPFGPRLRRAWLRRQPKAPHMPAG